MMLMMEKVPNMMRPQNRVNSLIPESSKLSRSIRPKEAQNRVWLVSQRLKIKVKEYETKFTGILLGKFSVSKAVIDLNDDLVIFLDLGLDRYFFLCVLFIHLQRIPEKN